jgi:DNA processing protein
MSGRQRPTGGTGGDRTAVTVASHPAPAVVAATGRPAVDVLRARAYLSRVAEPPAPALAAFVEVLGPVTAAARVRVGDVPDPVAGETAARRTTDRADADLEAARVAGARLLVPEDAA